MRIQFVVCAQSVSIDQATSRLSIFNVLELIGVPAFPIWIPEMVLVAGLFREGQDLIETKGMLEIELEGNQLVRTEMLIAFHNGPIARMVFNLAGLPVNSPGNLAFKLSVAETDTRILKIPVLQVGQ